jgi:dGTPase
VEFPGLNLAWETRESIIKHTTRHDHPMDNQFEPHLRPLLESQIVEVADEIAYDNHDLDDGLRAGIISEQELAGISLWDEAFATVGKQYANLDPKIHRALAVRHLINFEVTDIITNSERLLNEKNIRSVEDVRKAPLHLIAFSDAVRERKIEMEQYLKENMYQYYRVARMADKAKRFIKALFESYQSSPKSLPPEYQKRAKEEGLERVLCDYIAGMTDRFAQDEYKRLFHPFERV